MDCYVYYKADVRHDQELIACFHQLQKSLEQFGIAPLLQRRPETKDSMHTWMEVYTDIPSDFTSIMESLLTASGLIKFIVGERHTEHFIRV
jgi:hypothetical protein